MAGRLSLLGAGRQTAPSSGTGDWTPLSVSGLQSWLDWSDNTTIFKDAGVTLASDGDYCVQINDKTGDGKYIRQTNTGRCGIYKTGIQNGNNALLNAGATRGQTFSGYGGVLRNVAGATMALVVSVNAIDVLNGIITFSLSGSVTYQRMALDINSGKVRMIVNNTDDYAMRATLEGGTSIGTATHAVIVGVVDYYNGDGWIYLNGNLDASSTTFIDDANTTQGTDGNTPDTDGIGGQYGREISAFHSGYLDEIVLYNSVLSADDRTALTTYLMTKWGIS